MLNRRRFLGSIALGAGVSLAVPGAAALAQVQRMQQGAAGYRVVRMEDEIFSQTCDSVFISFRIPSVVTTDMGRVLAFCEGRLRRSDHGDTDILVKCFNQGQWRHPAALQGVQAERSCGNQKYGIVIGLEDVTTATGTVAKSSNWRNPTSVFANGRVFLFLNVDQDNAELDQVITGTSKHPTRLFMLRSNNEQNWATQGLRWEKPVEITLPADGLPRLDGWAAFGPGSAIVVDQQIFVPLNATKRGEHTGSYAMVFDFSGRLLRVSPPAGGGTECQIVHLGGQQLLMSKRSANTQSFYLSNDLARSWRRQVDPAGSITTPTTQTGLFRDRRGQWLITGPNNAPSLASAPKIERGYKGVNSPDDRYDMSLWHSPTPLQSQSWSSPIPLESEATRCRRAPGCSNNNGYSVITQLASGNILVVYEDSKHGVRETRIVAAELEYRL